MENNEINKAENSTASKKMEIFKHPFMLFVVFFVVFGGKYAYFFSNYIYGLLILVLALSVFYFWEKCENNFFIGVFLSVFFYILLQTNMLFGGVALLVFMFFLFDRNKDKISKQPLFIKHRTVPVFLFNGFFVLLLIGGWMLNANYVDYGLCAICAIPSLLIFVTIIALLRKFLQKYFNNFLKNKGLDGSEV